MKKDNEHMEREVNLTLSALDDMQKASPKPYFYTRVNARLQALYYQPDHSWISGPIWIRVIVSIIIFLILVNIYTVSTVQKPDVATTQLPAGDELQSFVGDYYPQNPTAYNLDEAINNQ